MLNPVCVDYSQGKVKIVFTDDNVDKCLSVYLTEEDGFRLAQMLIDKTNYLAKLERAGKPDKFDITF